MTHDPILVYVIPAICGCFGYLLFYSLSKYFSLKKELTLETKNSQYLKTRNDELVMRIRALQRDCELRTDMAKRNQESLLKFRD